MHNSSPAITLDLQHACKQENTPSIADFQTWVNAALLPYKKPFELSKDAELLVKAHRIGFKSSEIIEVNISDLK